MRLGSFFTSGMGRGLVVRYLWSTSSSEAVEVEGATSVAVVAQADLGLVRIQRYRATRLQSPSVAAARNELARKAALAQIAVLAPLPRARAVAVAAGCRGRAQGKTAAPVAALERRKAAAQTAAALETLRPRAHHRATQVARLLSALVVLPGMTLPLAAVAARVLLGLTLLIHSLAAEETAATQVLLAALSRMQGEAAAADTTGQQARPR